MVCDRGLIPPQSAKRGAMAGCHGPVIRFLDATADVPARGIEH